MRFFSDNAAPVHPAIFTAMADGASHFRVLWQSIAPLSLPAFVTLVVNALWVWNELLIALVFLPEDRLKTLMVGITVFQGRYSLDVPVLMAGMLLASVPMLILYLIGGAAIAANFLLIVITRPGDRRRRTRRPARLPCATPRAIPRHVSAAVQLDLHLTLAFFTML